MKKLALLLSALLMSSVASASVLSDFWTDLKSKSDLQLLDNASPSTFYNLKKGVDADERIKGGFQTTFYSYRLLDVNFAVLKDIKTGDNPVPGGAVGLRFEKYVAQLCSKIAPLLGENIESPLFQRLRLGGYYAKDFKAHKESYGIAAYWIFGGKVED